MLYPTHHPFFIPFNSFTIPNPPPSTTTTITPLPPIQGMECVEGALKSSFRPEMAVKKTQQQQAILDDLWTTVNAPNAVSGDDFSVDDLLDFSKGGIEDGFFEEQQEEQTKPSSLSVFTQHEQDPKTENDRSSNYSAVDELSVPADDLADLEWLSHFVEESEEFSLTYPAGKLPEKTTEDRSDPPEIGALSKPSFTTPVQTKARSKRVRTGSRIWSLGSASLTESSSSSTTSTSSSTLSSSPLIYTGPSQTADSLLWPLPVTVLKKQKKRKMEVSGGGGGGSQQPRRCSHCLVQKTPQWRTGPNGAKTLCNACGVRYKSGRLLPEYRPACSPTFSSEVHSNNHRKVLEMRRKKEVETGLAPPVQSF